MVHAIATQTTTARNVGTKANTTAANSTAVASSWVCFAPRKPDSARTNSRSTQGSAAYTSRSLRRPLLNAIYGSGTATYITIPIARARSEKYPDGTFHIPNAPTNTDPTMSAVCNAPVRPKEIAPASAISTYPLGFDPAEPNPP